MEADIVQAVEAEILKLEVLLLVLEYRDFDVLQDQRLHRRDSIPD